MTFSFKNVFSSIQKKPVIGQRKVVGIDFGSSSIKVVEIELKEGVVSLSTYGELQLGPYAQLDMGSVVHLEADKKIEALVDVMRESSVTAKEGVFALPLSSSFVTVMSLPVKDDEDIDSRVRVEARKYIPIALTEVALEWSEVPPIQKEAKPISKEVLLAAIQNTALSEYAAILKAVQMSQQPAEIELFSTLRAVTETTEVGAIVVIDMGAEVSKLYIAEVGFLRRIHRIQIGGSHVTQKIAKELKCTFEEAENIKRQYGVVGENDVRISKMFENVYNPVFAEFKRVINQYEIRTQKEISRVVLTGGGVLFPQAITIAQDALTKKVERSNPFNKIAYPAFLEDTLESITPVFSVALGAALRQFEQ